MNFVNPSNDPVTIGYWEEGGTDTSENFRINCKKLGKDWIYNSKSISYVYNELGFRNKPFNEVDWKNSIIILGCSNVKGTGHAIEDTIGHRLEKILNIPVVNLGVSGSAVDTACWNSLILHDHYPWPRAIVQLWTGLDRYTNFDGELYKNFMPTNIKYCTAHIWKDRSKFYVKADRALWKNKTVYYEGSQFLHTAKELDIDFYDQTDNARDQNHPGIKSHTMAAEGIAKNLIKLGIK